MRPYYNTSETKGDIRVSLDGRFRRPLGDPEPLGFLPWCQSRAFSREKIPVSPNSIRKGCGLDFDEPLKLWRSELRPMASVIADLRYEAVRTSELLGLPFSFLFFFLFPIPL